jgi:urease accessory protein
MTAGQPLDRGEVARDPAWPGVWLERGRIGADDRHLLDSPLGLDGCSVLATLWFAAGTPRPDGSPTPVGY